MNKWMIVLFSVLLVGVLCILREIQSGLAETKMDWFQVKYQTTNSFMVTTITNREGFWFAELMIGDDPVVTKRVLVPNEIPVGSMVRLRGYHVTEKYGPMNMSIISAVPVE